MADGITGGALHVSSDPSVELTRDELVRVLDAARIIAQARGPGYESVLSAVLEATLLASESDHAALYILDVAREAAVYAGDRPPKPEMPTLLAEIPLAGSLTGKHVATLQPGAYAAEQVGPRIAAMHAFAMKHVGIAPLHLQGKAWGVLYVARGSERPFDAHDLRVVMLLGELIAVYLENARLYTDAQGRLEETRMLLDVGRAVSASIELNESLRASAQILAKLVDASNVYIALLEGDGTILRGVACSDDARRDVVLGLRISMTEDATSIAVRAIKAAGPVVDEDASASKTVQRHIVDRFEEKSLLALPLRARGEAMGVVVIDDTRRTRTWSAAEIERAELIVHQIAGAVANARLYDEVKRGYEELAHAQMELVKRERLAALGQLAATLAHEVRNPLGVLFNSIGTLSKMLPSQGDASTLLAIMSEEAQRLDRLVRELLDFVRPLAPTMEVTSLGAVVDGAVEAAARELGEPAAKIRSTIPPAFPSVRVDGRMLRRALVNLLVNGAQAAGPAGTVVVNAVVERESERPGVVLEVSDTGPGIDGEVAPRMFEPFFTTKATGTGLGLAVVKEIVDAHAGDVTVKSVAGRGTTISIRLPIDGAG